MRISALDLYVHEFVAQNMLAIFDRTRPPSIANLRFQISNETLDQIRTATTPSDANSAFDLEVRSQLEKRTFQDPNDIADGIRLISDVELWNEVALKLGATVTTKVSTAKALKTDLSLMVRRRNKIVHEGDLQPSPPRVPWPITQTDVAFVKSHVERIVRAIDAVI